MKSNIEYLREDISKAQFMPVSFKNQLYEWIDGIENDLKGDGSNSGDDEDKDERINELEQEVASYQEDWIDPDNLKEIDCGIGAVKYLQPDNLKLQMIMDDFKQKHEASLQTLSLFQ